MYELVSCLPDLQTQSGHQSSL